MFSYALQLFVNLSALAAKLLILAKPRVIWKQDCANTPEFLLLLEIELNLILILPKRNFIYYTTIYLFMWFWQFFHISEQQQWFTKTLSLKITLASVETWILLNPLYYYANDDVNVPLMIALLIIPKKWSKAILRDHYQ